MGTESKSAKSPNGVLKKKIKEEPMEEMTFVEFDGLTVDSTTYADLSGEELLSLPLDTLKTPVSKHTSSPAQEATKAKINAIQVQLRKLYKLRTDGKLDTKSALQLRCLEEELRKAHSKLRRLLNEAERQRRRRERLRTGASSGSPAKTMMLMTVRGKRDGFHGYSEPRATITYSAGQSDDGLLVTSTSAQDDLGVMTAFRNCGKFEDFLSEINNMGFSLTKTGSDQPVYDVSEADVEGCSNGEVKVQVELIEGDGVLDENMTVVDPEIQEIKAEPLSPSSSPGPEGKSKDSSNGITRNSKRNRQSSAACIQAFAEEYARKQATCLREWQEQYQEWFERQVESQQQWEETFMREQMELTKSMMENVTSSFLQGMQQVMQNVVASIGRRTLTPFIPSFSRDLDANGLNRSEIPLFVSAGTSNSGPTVLSTRSLANDKDVDI